jgi:hypothetical protein
MRPARLAGITSLMTLAMVGGIVLTARPVQGQSLFGANSVVSCPGPSNLYSIDPTTGTATVIGPIVGPGPTNFCLVTAMAFDPTTRILYAIACPGSSCTSSVLLTIDPATGAATQVGPPIGAFATDMSFRSDGTLYAYESDFGFVPAFVFTVDKSTGSGTLVGFSGVGGGGNGIAFSPTDVLFHSSNSDLHTLDQTTGAATLVTGLTFPGTCGGFQRVNAMDFQPGTGTLFGSLNCGNSTWHIGTIDTSTGTITDVGPTVNNLDALAFQPGLTGLSPAKLWVGLKNSDDVGLRLDLKAEVFINSTGNPPAGTGERDNVSSGSSGFNNALLNTVNLALTNGPVSLAPSDVLLLRVSVRRTCSGGGHASGTARLWYNGKAIDTGASRDAGSRFDATIAGSTSDYYLRTGFNLSTTAGSSRTSIDKFVDSSTACPARPFVSFGTWSITP